MTTINTQHSTQTVKIYNSLTGKKEVFESITPGKIGMYVCGPTVYSEVHLGNCRTFVSFDLIYRYLTHLGYSVRYVRNITDAGHLEHDAEEGEDKISKKARLEQLEPMEVVQRYTLDFHKILSKLNTLPPNIEPTATGHIIEQIELIKTLIDREYAYAVNGSVYFDVKRYNTEYNYGELSGRNIEDLVANTRELTAQHEKKNPQDFALWKKASPQHIMRWQSPWSDGFPGWHLECTTMSTKYLGKTFDIHGGGIDLKFPHHECEIAQGKAAYGVAPVRYWMHTNMLTLQGKKMSKSTGNCIEPAAIFAGTTTQLDKAYPPTVVRFFMLQAHYRSVLDFSNDALAASQKGYKKLMLALDNLVSLPTSESTKNLDVTTWVQSCYDAMNDDFNSPMLIAKLFDIVRFIQEIKTGKAAISDADLEILKTHTYAFAFTILGLEKPKRNSDNLHKNTLDGVMQLVIDLRAKARANRDFETSDTIRDTLQKLGIKLKDCREETQYLIQD